MSDADKARLSSDLGAGKAAIGILTKIEDAPMVQKQLTELGGKTSSHDVVDEAALQTATAEQSR